MECYLSSILVGTGYAIQTNHSKSYCLFCCLPSQRLPENMKKQKKSARTKLAPNVAHVCLFVAI